MVPTNTYQNFVVAYLDVIGMKEAVQKSVADPEIASKLEKMLSELKKRCAELNKRWRAEIPPLNAQAFSDNIVLTCPISSDDLNVSDLVLRKIAYFVSAYQTEVAYVHGYFLRGAITAGLHCERGDICFGPAFVEATEAEKQLANWPRVVVLPKALELIAHGRHPYLKRDDEGITYIDHLHLSITSLILNSSKSENKEGGINSFSWVPIIEEQKSTIETAVKNLDTDSPQYLSKLSKYHSLAQYHNKYLRQYLRGGKNFPLTEVVELILSSQKGMTKERMHREVAKLTRLLAEVDEKINSCLINMGKLFAPLRHRGPRK